MKSKTKTTHSGIINKIILIALIVVSLSLTSIYLLIEQSIKNHCVAAQSEYLGDCGSSLISLVSDDKKNFHSKNDAIWTLGRLKYQEALPFLQSLYTGNIPAREPYDSVLSQYELKKAILRIDKNADVTPKPEKALKEKIAECLPLSNWKSKQICDSLIQSIKTYSACVEAGFPIQKSNPEQCTTIDGRSFTNTR